MTTDNPLNLDRARLARVIQTLRAAQSHIGARRPDEEDDADEARYWDDFDDGIKCLKDLVGNSGPYLVRTVRPFWASDENTASDAEFFFRGLRAGSITQLGTIVDIAGPQYAYEFQTLMAAELFAVQLGGTVVTWHQVVKQLRDLADEGSKYAVDALNHMLPRHGERL